MIKIGDRVRITRPGSVHWFTGPHMRDRPMPITGTIIEIDFYHVEGRHARPYKIRFDDTRESWYDSWEFEEIKQ
jgi:hypothetical protein